MPDPTEFPDPEQLADDEDELAWDHEEHGGMADYATPDDAVTTEDYDGSDDPDAVSD